jgi:hypothetical protein
MMTGYLTAAGEVRNKREEKRENEPCAVLRAGGGMVEPIPTLGRDKIPPSLVSLVASHDDVFRVHTGELDRQLLLNLPDTASEDGN